MSSGSEPLPQLPEAPPSRVYGQGYSSNHPVPTVQGYKEVKAQHEEDAKQYAEIVARRAQEQEERDKQREAATQQSDEKDKSENKEEYQNVSDEKNAAKTQKDKKDKPVANQAASEKARMMDQMNANKQRPTDRQAKADHGERRVRDPITGGEIVVKDADPKGKYRTKPQALIYDIADPNSST
jgi:hypothetical protein